MLAETIRNAVEVLHQQGQRISVHAVHALSGGSLRDVHRLLGEVLPQIEGEAMPASVTVLPLLSIAEHPDVQDVRARLRTLEGEGVDLQRLVEAHQRTVDILRLECETLDNAVFLGQQPASALDRLQTALRGAYAELQAAEADVVAHRARQERLAGLARDIEADTAAIVEQYLRAAYQDAVCTLDQWLLGMGEALQPVRALQEHARREFPHRTVLPHVEPVARPLHPSQPVGLEDLFYLWEHDRDVQRLLGGRA
jgi:hypothetical protein